MDLIENIWEKGHEQISEDGILDRAFILKSISESSISISAKLQKIIWFGLALSVLASIAFVYNFFFYYSNTPVAVLIVLIFVLCVLIFAFLLKQKSLLITMDAEGFDLQQLLMFKIKYFNTHFQWVLRGVAMIVVLASFTINLSMENSDGVFEIHKILILSTFYFFMYLGLVFLYRMLFRVNLKQLKNALENLVESEFKSFDKELNKSKRLQRIIGVFAVIIFIFGLVAMLFMSYAK